MSEIDRRLSELAGAAAGAARLQPAEALRRRGQGRVVRRRAIGGGILAVLVAVSLTALINRGGAQNPPPDLATSPTVAPSTGPSVQPSAEPSAHPSAGPSVEPSRPASSSAPGGRVSCSLGQLEITISDNGRQEGAGGHVSTALLLRNNGSTPCSLTGYPNVAGLDSAAHIVAEARQTRSGFMGGLKTGQPPTLTLAPGQVASALFEALTANPDGSACVRYASLRVTPPGQPDGVTIKWDLQGCAQPEIHPIVPGDSGRA